jgi:hypothetical protein
MEKRMRGVEKTLKMHLEVLQAKRLQRLSVIKEERADLEGITGTGQ